MEQQDRRGSQVEEEQQKGHGNFDAGVARTSAFSEVSCAPCFFQESSKALRPALRHTEKSPDHFGMAIPDIYGILTPRRPPRLPRARGHGERGPGTSSLLRCCVQRAGCR